MNQKWRDEKYRPVPALFTGQFRSIPPSASRYRDSQAQALFTFIQPCRNLFGKVCAFPLTPQSHSAHANRMASLRPVQMEFAIGLGRLACVSFGCGALNIPPPISAGDCSVIFIEARRIYFHSPQFRSTVLSTFRKPIVNDLDFNSQASMRRILQEQIEE
jgi:hypothetical protein